MEIPVACTLDTGPARAQLDEWQELLTGQIETLRRVRPGRLEVTLQSGFDQVESLVGLAQREVRCCPFFAFSLSIGGEALRLVIEVPDGAAPILDAFVLHP